MAPSISIEEKRHPTGSFFDRLQLDSNTQEVEPFCMASIIKEFSSGYLKEDYFTLRLELRTRSSVNESVASYIHESTTFCEVSVRNAPFNSRITDHVSGTSDIHGR